MLTAGHKLSLHIQIDNDYVVIQTQFSIEICSTNYVFVVDFCLSTLNLVG